MSDKLVLIDGHSILNRAFFGLPDLTNAQGLHTNAIYGFLNILFKILEEEQPQYLMVAFDVHAPTFRHKMFDAYKGTRKPMVDELRQQVPVMKDMLCAMGITVIEKEGYEADDILGTIAKQSEKQGIEVSVVSGDRDLLQLATEHIKIRIPKTKRTGTEIEDYYAGDVLERYQVTPIQFIDVKALMGDASDNIPGVPGIGEKTATNLIVSYGSIEHAYAHIEEIKPNRAKEMLKEHYDMAQMSKRLATIMIDAPVSYALAEAKIGNLYTPEAYIMCKQLEFKNLLSRFQIDTTNNQQEENFRLITKLDEAETFFTAAKSEKIVGFACIAERDAFLGMAVSLPNGETVFLQAEGFLTKDYLIGKLQELFREGICGVTFDLKPQLSYFDDRDPKHFFDVKIAAYLLNPLKNEYSYEDVAKDYLDEMIPSRQDLIGKHQFTTAVEEQPDNVLKCVCHMASVNLRSMKKLKEQMVEENMYHLFEDIEMPLVFTLFDMEQAGIVIDAEALKVYGEELGSKITELEQRIYEGAGEQFNINSPKQLGVILFEKLQMPFGKKTKTGYSTAADVLEKLAPEYPFVAQILEYRQLAKLKSTYADGLANYIAEDGRIHSTFNQTITATGRISSTEPNLQNIPIRMELGRLIRKVFLPAKGCIFMDADYSQIELRVLAHMSGDKMLIKAYQEAQDIHAMTASQVFHIPFDEVTPLQRRNAKAVNFGIVYGISSFGLSQDLSITRKEAEGYIKNYFETYPKIKSFLDSLVESARNDGYVTTMFGRRRPVPEISSSNFMQRSFGERIAMNSPIQGTAADIIKIAMIRVHDRLKQEGLKSRLILQVHDELLIETEREEETAVAAILEEEMKQAAQLAVTLEIDMHTGTNWYEAK